MIPTPGVGLQTPMDITPCKNVTLDLMKDVSGISCVEIKSGCSFGLLEVVFTNLLLSTGIQHLRMTLKNVKNFGTSMKGTVKDWSY